MNFRELPKIDLHCHLDGSLPLDTVRELTGNRDIRLDELQADRDCKSLKEYLEKFDLPLQGMQTEAHLKRAAKDFLIEISKENICYVEVRFAPMLSVTENLSCSQVIAAVLEGLYEAQRQVGTAWQLIICAMRHHSRKQNTKALEGALEFFGKGVCALDLAGDEAAFPTKDFRWLFQRAGAAGIPYTIHSGECGSVENMREALELGAARVGHGIALAQDAELMLQYRERHIGIEMCVTSNLQTKAAECMEDYPMKQFLEYGLCVSANTDNRTVSRTDMTQELEILYKWFGDEQIILRLLKNAVEMSFAPEHEKCRIREKIRVFLEKENIVFKEGI